MGPRDTKQWVLYSKELLSCTWEQQWYFHSSTGTLAPVLRAMGQSSDIAQEGQTFARGIMLQLYAMALSYPMQRFLQAQNIVIPLACMVIGVFCLHILLSWVVIFVLGYGLFGAALTLSFLGGFLCSSMGSTLLWAHHVRKLGQDSLWRLSQGYGLISRVQLLLVLCGGMCHVLLSLLLFFFLS